MHRSHPPQTETIYVYVKQIKGFFTVHQEERERDAHTADGALEREAGRGREQTH